MTRISLKEAYDNRDVVGQIARLTDEVNEHTEILDNLPNPDLTNCVIKDTDQIITGEKTFTKVIKAEGGIEVNTSGGFEIDGQLTVNGDIIQNGQAYETHAEQVFSQNDLIVTRDGAVSALPAGVVSGIQIKKYDGVNDARLAVDNQGVARVGDVGDEQPLMTRAEVADMVGGAFLKWDAVHWKAVSGTLDDSVTAGSSNGVKSSGIKTAIDDVKTAIEGELETAIAGKVSGTGNIGTDTRPVKIVNGQAVTVGYSLVKAPTQATYVIRSGFATIRIQTATQHSVTVPCGNSDPNTLFPVVTNGTQGSSWGDVRLSVGGRTTSGFTIYSWITDQNVDRTIDVFWMALVKE